MTIENKKKFIIQSLFALVVALLIGFVLKYLTAWLLPFVIGLVVAVLLNRPITFMTRKTKLPRRIWSFIFVSTTLLIIFTVIGLICYRIYYELGGLVKWIISNQDDLLKRLDDLSVYFAGYLAELPEGIRVSLESAPENLIANAISFISGSLPKLATIAVSDVPNIVIITVMAIISSFFIAADFPKISRFFYAQLNERTLQIIAKSKILFKENILKMLVGYGLIMLITFAELFLGLSVLNIKYAWVLAIITALLDMLPILGTGVLLFPLAIIKLLMGEYWVALALVGLYIAITIVRQIIEPKIIGKQVGLSPILTLVCIYLGLKFFGALGIVLLPLAVIILVKLNECGLLHLWKNVNQTEEIKEPEKAE